MTADAPGFMDQGLLSPVTAGQDAATSDTEIFAALLRAEVALVRAWEAVSDAPAGVAEAVEAAASQLDPQLTAVTVASTAGGNPVIPLVRLLREAVPERMSAWVHRGATSQDILDSALMLVAASTASATSARLRGLETSLTAIARRERDTSAAARSLTQHAVPTTVGLRVATWLSGVRRSRHRLDTARAALPAQLGGAAGTLASFVELSDAPTARRLVAAYADILGLTTPRSPWHTTRWPVTELGDALMQTIDAVGAMAADVATLSRTEIGEV
ncbi:MAG TPA: lyase family protein, partial [Terrimesophilobacter sp.]|nr:lyase family protein [Terrimesophilobacter sp.]